MRVRVLLNMRKFDSKRLYKFIKLLVIILTILLFISAWSAHNSIKYWDDQVIKNDKMCYDTYPFKNDPADPNDRAGQLNVKLREGCLKPSTDFNNYSLSNAGFEINSIALGILLPLLFFGGTWLYKYLFPVKQSD